MESSQFVQNTSDMYERNSASQPIVGPNGALYYPARNPVVCYNCGEEWHVCSQCPKMRSQGPSYTSAGHDVVRPDIRPSDDILPPLPPLLPPVRASGQNVSVVEIAMKSSALEGVKVREVTATTTEEAVDLRQFVNRIEEVDKGDDLESDGTMNRLRMKITRYQSWLERVPAVSVNCHPSLMVNVGLLDNVAGQLTQPMMKREKKRLQGGQKLRQTLWRLGNPFE